MLEEEVYSQSSPIWSQDYLAGVSGGQIPIHTGNTLTGKATHQGLHVRNVFHGGGETLNLKWAHVHFRTS